MLSFTTNRNKTENQKLLFNEVCKTLERRWVEIKGKLEESCQTLDQIICPGASPLIVQAPSDNFWILMNKTHFNDLVESGKNSPRPLLLKDIKGFILFLCLFCCDIPLLQMVACLPAFFTIQNFSLPNSLLNQRTGLLIQWRKSPQVILVTITHST